MDHSPYSFLTLLLFLCIPFQASHADAQSDQLIAHYDEMASSLAETHETKRKQMGDRYLKALDQVEEAERAKKAFNNLLVIKREKRRFSQDLTLEASDLNKTVASLGRLQGKVIHAFQKLDREHKTTRYKLMKSMVEKLDAEHARLLEVPDQQGADQVQAKRESIQAEPLYVQAEKVIQQREMAKLWNDSKDAAETAQPSAPVARPTPVVVTTKPMLEVSLVKRNLSKLAREGDYDDKVQNLQFEVKLQSREFITNYENLKIDVWVVGKGVQSSREMKLLIKDRIEVDSLPRGKRFEGETKMVRNKYDDNRAAQYGYKYYGYLLEIKDAEGTLLYSKASPSRIEREADVVRESNEGSTFIL